MSLKIFLIFTLLFFSLSGCAPYLEQSRRMLDSYYRGDFQEAADFADKVHPRKADKLLAYLDKGAVYHAAKRYDKSNKFFTKAERIAEENEKLLALPQIGAVFANDNVMPFIASPYERLLIHLFKIMNYAETEEMEEALVEVRRINTVFPDIYSESERRTQMRSPFNAYLSGLIWEANGLCNDAYIDYKRLQKLGQKAPKGFSVDLKRTARCAGLSGEVEEAGKRPNLVVILESGRSPVKVSTEYDHPIQVFPVPLYRSRPSSISGAIIKIDGKKIGKTEILEDVDSALKSVLEEQMPGIIARAAARLAVKTAAAVAVGEKVDKGLGIMVGTLAYATNRADLRSWKTLPEYFQIWRGFVPSGRHTILLEFLNKNGKKHASKSEVVDLKEGEMEFLIVRTVK